jgi:protein-S-isoprenylcysteine O-methyltransferase Ste14
VHEVWPRYRERSRCELAAVIASFRQVLFLLFIAVVLLHFLWAGGRRFVVEPMEVGTAIAQASFLGGALVVALTGAYHRINPYLGAAATVTLLCSLALYEWARRTVRGRRFRVAFNGDVPDSLCESGPYCYIRHPFYVSYMLAFAAAIALPAFPTSALLVANVAVFVCAAVSDERAIAHRKIGSDYAAYRARVGRFVPHLWPRNQR